MHAYYCKLQHIIGVGVFGNWSGQVDAFYQMRQNALQAKRLRLKITETNSSNTPRHNLRVSTAWTSLRRLERPSVWTVRMHTNYLSSLGLRMPNTEKQVENVAKQAANHVDSIDKNKDKVKDGIGKAAGAVGIDQAGAVLLLLQTAVDHRPYHHSC